MTVTALHKDVIDDILSEDCDEYVLIHEQVGESRRWQTPILVVFQKKGEGFSPLYGATYMRGNTDNQESEWAEIDHTTGMVKVHPVKEEEVVITTYRIVR